MLNRLVEQKQTIRMYLTRYNNRSLDLSGEEWNLISEFETLLKPFEEVSKIMCEDSAPISLQLPLVEMIH